MSPEVLIFVAGAAIALVGALLATTSANLMKRVQGGVIAFAGVVAALLGVGASDAGLMMTVVVVAFAYLVLGAALVIRVKEIYNSIDVSDLDAADRDAEPRERAP